MSLYYRCPGEGAKLAVGIAVGVGATATAATAVYFFYKHYVENTPPKRYTN